MNVREKEINNIIIMRFHLLNYQMNFMMITYPLVMIHQGENSFREFMILEISFSSFIHELSIFL